MKGLVAVLAAFSLALFTAPSVSAAGVTKAEITKLLSDQGYNVWEQSANSLRVHVAGYDIFITVAGADGDVSYRTWLTNVSANDVGLQLLNKFNNEVKFGRAYIDGDGDVTIQMDRNSAGGVSAENIESDFDVFLLLVSKFLTDLEDQAVA